MSDSPSPRRVPRRGRAVVLSTYHENIGDDLIRDGTLALLRRIFGPLAFHHLAKSNPLGAALPPSYLAHGPAHRMTGPVRFAVRALDRVLRLRPARPADLAVVAGTPLFYHLPYGTFLELEPWVDHFYRRVLEAAPVPLLALGLGSILPGDPPRFPAGYARERQFVADFVDRSFIVTARDDGTFALLNECRRVGSQTPVFRTLCPSFWAADGFGIRREQVAAEARLVSVSFSVESLRWDEHAGEAVRRRWAAVRAVLGQLARRGYDARLVCHNEYDVPVAKRLAREYRLRSPLRATSRTMLDQFARSRAAITWRVHGALGAHSLGVPALLFRTDSRVGLAEELGIPVVDDRVHTEPELVAALDRLFAGGPPDRLPALRDRMTREEADIRRAVGELIPEGNAGSPPYCSMEWRNPRDVGRLARC